MTDGDVLQLELRSQRLTRDKRGRNCWQVLTGARTVPAERAALLLCDVWDDHHCRGAVERLEAMLPRMNELVSAARAMGVRVSPLSSARTSTSSARTTHRLPRARAAPRCSTTATNTPAGT